MPSLALKTKSGLFLSSMLDRNLIISFFTDFVSLESYDLDYSDNYLLSSILSSSLFIYELNCIGECIII